MHFDNSKIRRKDRTLSKKEALDLLKTGEYGILSMVETRNNIYAGYGIPLNYVWNGNKSIYIHCAPEGFKLDCLIQNPYTSFCIVGKTNIISNKFTTEYKSIIIRGKIETNLAPEERQSALIMLVDKYSPNHKEEGIKHITKSFYRTNVIKLNITEMSGKTKKVNL